METVDLSDAHAKLDRARHHIAEIDARIALYLATDFYRIRFEPDEKSGRLLVCLDSLHQIDKSINAMIGDAVGNLRSSLDYAAVALAGPLGRNVKDIGFPNADNANQFAGQVKGPRFLGNASAAIQGYFIDHVQAYRGGAGHNLWVLNQLRNTDKHRFLVATASLAGIKADMRIGGIGFGSMTIAFEAGKSGEMVSCPLGQFEFTNDPSPVFEIAFREPPHADNTPVSAFLHRTAGDVQSLLNSLEVFT